MGMAIPRHCGVQSAHGRHVYYGPSPKSGESKQVLYACPGTTGREPKRKPKKK